MAKANTQNTEGCGRECTSSIQCIFLSEFHPVHGSKISCQVPENYVPKELFDAVNVYIIPKPTQIQRCVLTINCSGLGVSARGGNRPTLYNKEIVQKQINSQGWKIVGYPVRIESPKYERNAYYFNLCFVCHGGARTIQYEPVVKKLAEYLAMMEEEICFLSKDTGGKIERLLTQTMKDLNEKKATTIIEGDTTIYLKIVQLRTDPPTVMDHMVPTLEPQVRNMPLELWDLTSQQVIPYINGVNHVARIAAEADVENALVKACIQNLVYYGVVKLLPLIKYSNVYMCTRKLQNLAKNQSLFHACRAAIMLKADQEKPSLHKILQLYSFMTHGVTLRTLCQRLSPRDNNIDERQLVTFGLQHKLIRCINKYPIFTGKPPDVPTGRQKLYDGLYNLDEICSITGLSPAKIEAEIDADTNVTVIWK
ncbi:GATOR complex protein NPRL2 [Sergentomyia squamirostris]